MDYEARMDELEAKIEREGLTEQEKAELALIKSRELSELRDSFKRSSELLAQLKQEIESLKNFH